MLSRYNKWIVSCQLAIFLLGIQAEMADVRCAESSTTCKFTLVVDYGLTMMRGDKLVKAVDGRLYQYDVTNFTSEHVVSSDNVITGDGHFEPRLVMTYNGTIPGPSLHVRAGQVVILTTINRMVHETTSVHIHGQYQRGTPYSDGVPFITQCPILPGQTFVQTFTADPEGTFFYHSHSGPQMTNGLYGAFIVHPSATEEVRGNSGVGVPGSASRARVALEDEKILIFQDWNHDWDANMEMLKMRFGLFHGSKRLPITHNLAGAHYSAFEFQSGIINGRGRFYQYQGKHNGAPLTKIAVQPNKSYRLRLLNTGNIHPFRVSIDGHPLLVVASDGAAIQPVAVESVMVNPGERFDVFIQTNQSVANYWIRGQTLQVGFNNTAEAILHYEGSSNSNEPESTKHNCTKSDPCIVLNCPFLYFPKGSHTKCYNFDRIRALAPCKLQGPEDTITERFLNFAFPGDTETPGSVNGKSFVTPTTCSLSQHHKLDLSCSAEECGPDQVCHCPYSITCQHNDLIQLVLLNMGQGKGWDHPIHMHGHAFQVIKMGFPTYNKTTGKFIRQSGDINCGHHFCNNATWAKHFWYHGNIPDAEVERAPVKDNIIVPSGGYVVVRFRADNPGLWIIHCHLELHLTDGMRALLNESFSLWPPPPAGFPQCQSFHGATDNHLQTYGPR